MSYQEGRKMAEAAARGEDPTEVYDRDHGAYVNEADALPDAEKWGTDLNPVRDTDLAGTNLQAVKR